VHVLQAAKRVVQPQQQHPPDGQPSQWDEQDVVELGIGSPDERTKGSNPHESDHQHHQEKRPQNTGGDDNAARLGRLPEFV